MSSFNRKDRKTKIVCTIGPSSAAREVIFSLIKNGMNVARLNFSYGDYNTHKKAVELIRTGARKYGKPVAILQDLQGIKIRAGYFKGGKVDLKKGETVLLIPGEGIGGKDKIFISYPQLLRDVRRGNRILLDDGLIQLSVLERVKNAISAKVSEGGILNDKKGVNLPGIKLSVKSFTEKDEKDLHFGIDIGIDYVAISFVRNADDIRKVRRWLKQRKRNIPIIAKIEKEEAICNIEEILSEADGIMVARGDLGVEIPSEEVPLIQKGLVDKANKNGKFVIIATQMLESMTEHLSPTRAETADVANAVLDGTDALMLSAETANGRYPIEAFKMMDRIIRYTESIKEIESAYARGDTFAEAVADAACRAAEDINTRVIIAFTHSGFTAKLASKFRPHVPIVAYTPYENVRNMMCLFWGVTPRIMRPLATTDQMVREVEKSLLKERIARKGDNIIIISGSPLSNLGKTNFMKLHKIGE
jgi:pyruvate kinase